MTKQPSKPAAPIKPSQMILLTHVMALVGRSAESDHIQLLLSDGAWYDRTSSWWWEFRADPPESIEEWSRAISKRLDIFRECRLVSVRASTRRASVKMRAAKAVGLGGGMSPRPSPRPGGGRSPRPASVAGSSTGRHSSVGSTSSRSSGFRKLLQNDSNFSLANAIEHWLLMLPCAPHGFFSARVSGQVAPYIGPRNVHSNFADADKFMAQTALDLQELEGMQWTDQAVKFLAGKGKVPDNLVLDFCFTMRQGVPDGLKYLLWSLAAGVYKQLPDATSLYDRSLALAFGEIVPHEFKGPVPTFSGDEVEPRPLEEVAPVAELLTEDGGFALSRLLWCARLLHAKLDFCPILPNLMAVLLLFFNEAETGVIVDKLLTKAEETRGADFPSLVTTVAYHDKQVRLVQKEGAHIDGAMQALKHLETMGASDSVLGWMMHDGFAHILPFRALCRIYGSLIAEGTETVVRYGLAILKLASGVILQCKDEEGVKRDLKSFLATLDQDHAQLDELMKGAFAARLRRSMKLVSSIATDVSSMNSRLLRGRLLCRPRLHQPRGFPPEEVWEAIWGWVPEIYRVLDPRLIYSSATDGRSLRTLLQKCKHHELAPMVFFVYSVSGALLGGFSPVMWRKTDGYLDLTGRLGVDESFVFRRTEPSEDADVFLWSGRNSLLFQASEVEGLLYGGDGASIFVDKDLKWACTTESKSFLADLNHLEEEGPAAEQPCPPLVKGTAGLPYVDFELLHIEVFVLR